MSKEKFLRVNYDLISTKLQNAKLNQSNKKEYSLRRTANSKPIVYKASPRLSRKSLNTSQPILYKHLEPCDIYNVKVVLSPFKLREESSEVMEENKEDEGKAAEVSSGDVSCPAEDEKNSEAEKQSEDGLVSPRGNTYTVSNPFSKRSRLRTRASNSQSEDNLAVAENTQDSPPEENTQLVWDRITSYKSTETETLSETHTANLSMVMDQAEKSDNTYVVRQEPDENPNEKDQIATEDENILADEECEKLLLYLCYRSFELLDFNDDSIWKKLGLRKEFTAKPWVIYKEHFFNVLAKCTDSYLVPPYFSIHVMQKYGEEEVDEEQTSPKKIRNHLQALLLRESKSLKKSRKRTSSRSSQEDGAQTCKKICNGAYTLDEDMFSTHNNTELRNGKTKATSKLSESEDIVPSSLQDGKENTKYLSPSSSEDKLVIDETPPRKSNRVKNRNAKIARSRSSSSSSQENNRTTPYDIDNSEDDTDYNPFRKWTKMKFQNSKHIFTLPTRPNSPDSEKVEDMISQVNDVISQVEDVISPKKSPRKIKVKAQRDLMSKGDTTRVSQPGTSTQLSPSTPSQARRSSRVSNSCDVTPIKTNPDRSIASPADSGKGRNNTYFKRTGRISYLSYEKEQMVKYIRDHSSQMTSIKGNNYWKEMEACNVCRNRTWQSMKNHFFKSLLYELDTYDLDRRFVQRLKKHCNLL